MNEVLLEGSNDFNINKDYFKVKDHVTDVEKVTIPDYTITRYQGKEGNYYPVRFDTDRKKNLLAVGFESTGGSPVFFPRTNNYSFKEGSDITFDLPVKEYISLYPGNLDESKHWNKTWNVTAPDFYYPLLMVYYTQVTFQEIEIANITKDISKNITTNTFHCNLTFNSISDFYPYPVKWKDVNLTLSEDFRDKYFDDYYLKVYHGDTYLGRLESDDTDLDKYIEPGDRIEIAAFNYTGDLKYISVQLETRHPSGGEQELSDLIIFTPRYDIYFEG